MKFAFCGGEFSLNIFITYSGKAYANPTPSCNAAIAKGNPKTLT